MTTLVIIFCVIAAALVWLIDIRAQRKHELGMRRVAIAVPMIKAGASASEINARLAAMEKVK